MKYGIKERKITIWSKLNEQVTEREVVDKDGNLMMPLKKGKVEGLVMAGEVAGLEGVWVTSDLIGKYCDTEQAKKVPINRMGELAEAVGSRFGLNPELEEPIHKIVKFGGKSNKAVFIPLSNY